MSRRYYSEINLHIVWHTKLSQPMLDQKTEERVHRAIVHKLHEFQGVVFHGIGGTQTHVHVALSIPPTVLICDLVGQLKGYSSHDINGFFHNGIKTFEWQAGYGVVSFGTQHLNWVLEYLAKQKDHHALGTTQDRLERAEE